MSVIPFHNYTTREEYRAFALEWFKKTYPDLLKIEEDNFERVSFDLFDICKNLIGTESNSANGVGFGGSHGEIRAAIAAAMGIAIEFDADEIRHFNDSTIAALTADWKKNNHDGFLARCAGYERNATNAKIDLLFVANEVAEGVYEMLEDTEDVIIDPVVAIYVEVLCEVTIVKKSIEGNRSRSRERRRPVDGLVRSLFDEDAA